MRIITRLVAPVIFLSMSLGAVALLSMGAINAAQVPVQEPVTNKTQQYRLGGCAFMAGLDPRFGAQSIVNQLPQPVARDIVELAKQKEEYGFIKNFTHKPIVYCCFADDQGVARMQNIVVVRFDQIRFDIFVKKFLKSRLKTCVSKKMSIYLRLLDVEHSITVRDVCVFELMNLSVYEDDKGIHLKVTSPNYDPVTYDAESIKPR